MGKRNWLDAYTAKAIRRQALLNGVDCKGLEIDNLIWVEAFNYKVPLYYFGKKLDLPAAVIPRLGSQIWNHEIALIRYLEQNNIFVLNNAQSILSSVNKFSTYQILNRNQVPFPKSAFVTSQTIRIVVDKEFNYPFLVKGLYSSRGKDQLIINNNEELEKFIEFDLSKKPMKKFLIQEFVQSSFGRSYRILVLDDEIIGSNLMLSKNDDYRTNFHQGAFVKPIDHLSSDIAQLAIDASNALGLLFASIDILFLTHGNYSVCDVNSSPGIYTFEINTNYSIADKLLKFITARKIK